MYGIEMYAYFVLLSWLIETFRNDQKSWRVEYPHNSFSNIPYPYNFFLPYPVSLYLFPKISRNPISPNGASQV